MSHGCEVAPTGRGRHFPRPSSCPTWFARQVWDDPGGFGSPRQNDARGRNDGGPMTRSNKGSFDMPSDDSAPNFEQRCPVCREPMRIVRLESGVPGLPLGMRRQMIKCSACELVTFHTFALESEP
jgi:hypothetical protein